MLCLIVLHLKTHHSTNLYLNHITHSLFSFYIQFVIRQVNF
nr:MAG TPA: hypothetical protein [Crassvirales sp.]DAU06354.1 MAG TPA: hypothetical protein [Caudoviricetes sp.]